MNPLTAFPPSLRSFSKKLSVLLVWLGCLLSTSAHAQSPVVRVVGQEIKALHISANLVVNTADELLGYVDRARAKGANTVFYSDSKLNTFGLTGTAGSRWDTEMRKFVEGVKSRNMKLHFITIVIGFGNSLLAGDPDLTTGYPIRDQPLRAVGNELRPVSTASVPNGGFEQSSNNVPDTWGFQDAAGQRTFVDTQVRRSGAASFRADARGGEMSRIFTAFPVKKFHQYTLRLWFKTENLTADNLLVLVRDANNKDRNLTNLRLSTPREGGGRSYFNRPNGLTQGWTEVHIAFNSLNATEVDLGLTVFGGQEGSVWWDDVSILDTPTLNWLNRDDLPRSVARDDGTSLRFNEDVFLPVDEKLGNSRYPGSYDTQHTPPTIRIKNSAAIREGDLVTISGYHGLPTANGQVSASWNNPETYQRMRTIHQTLQDEFQPDGYLLNYSEIRTGGWEPLDTQFATSGEALAASIKQAYNDLLEVAPNAEHFFWSDMVSPEHNAVANYYQVNNTLDQSWTTLDPKKVTIATWWEGQKITDKGPLDLAFFSRLGFKQIVGAYYDADVVDNYNRWQTAAQGVDNVEGSMFATWIKNYTNLEAFGDLWWSPGASEPALADRYWRFENKSTGQWVRTRSCATDYSEAVPLVGTSTNNTGNCTQLEFIPTDDGYYFIQNRATAGRYRAKDCSTVANDAVEIVQVGSGAYGWCEQWTLVDAGDGYYRIQNRQTGHWFRPQGCSGIADESVPITQVSQGYTGDCTKWKLVDAGPRESTATETAAPTTDALVLYPNPARHQVDLRTSHTQIPPEDIEQATLYDSQGNVVRQFASDSFASGQSRLDVSGIRGGVYRLSIELKQGKQQKIPLLIEY